jgi:hypothetical protein
MHFNWLNGLNGQPLDLILEDQGDISRFDWIGHEGPRLRGTSIWKMLTQP